MPGYSTNPRVRDLCGDIEAIRHDLHNVEFFRSGATVEDGELQVLRRWNSHTPMLQFSHGGGYLLRWRGKGTVIDPGVTFLDVFQRPHPVERMKAHHMDDIDLVLVTHDHADHCEDLGMLLVFLRNYNAWREDTPGLAPHKIDLVQSIGAHFRSVILLDNAENRPFVRAIDVPPPRRKPRSTSYYPLDLPNDFLMKLKELRTAHTEVLGGRSALGFRMKLQKEGGGEFVYCDTGDTKYVRELVKQYHGADLLLLHVGTMEDVKTEPSGRGEHLCFHGVVEVLKDLEKHGRPKLVLLGEWGEEFRGPGYRQRFTELVKNAAEFGGPVLPADLGMRVRLDDCCHVMCRKGSADVPTAPQDVVVVDWGQWIEYHAP